MKSFRMIFAALVVLAAVSAARAQTKESAPQEPPFTQENEFETPSTPAQTAPTTAPKDDIMSIEDELKAAEPKKEQSGPVNLNENVPEAGGKAENDNNVIPVEPEKQSAQEEPAVIPVEQPAKQVAPYQAPKADEVVRQSPKGGVEYIHHPQAAKGLLRIEQDGTYVYKTSEKTGYSTTGTFRVGSMTDAPKITGPNGVTFTMMYQGAPVPIFLFDYEMRPFKSVPQIIGQFGLGLLYAQGNGRFSCNGCAIDGQEAKEKYTFLAIPLDAGLTYRFQYADRQWFVPYVSGGGMYIPVAELRDDDASPHGTGTPGVYGAAGAMFSISSISKETAFTLRNEYDIANLWLTAEFRYMKTFNDELDFTTGIISVGIGVDY